MQIIGLTKSKDQSVEPIELTVDCMSDDRLQDVAFRSYVKRASLLLTDANVINDPVVEQVNYVVHILWMLLKKSGHPLRRKFAQYVSDELQLITSTLRIMCTCLEAEGENICIITVM